MTTLAQAEAIASATLDQGRTVGAAPLTVAVLDAGGHLVVLKRDDGSGILRPQIAQAKAWGALGMGFSSREIGRRAEAQPVFFASLAAVADGRFAPAAGGDPRAGRRRCAARGGGRQRRRVRRRRAVRAGRRRGRRTGARDRSVTSR